MNTKKVNGVLFEIGVGVLVLLFVYTGLSKLFMRHVFEKQLMRMPLVHLFPKFISYALPIVELVIAAMLLLKASRRLGLIVSFFLLTFFTFYLLYMLVFVSQLPCSCGGVLQQMGWKTHLVFNLCMMGIAAYMVLLTKPNKK